MYWMVWSRSAKLARGPDLSMMRICVENGREHSSLKVCSWGLQYEQVRGEKEEENAQQRSES